MATEIKKRGAYNKKIYNKNQALSKQILDSLGAIQFRTEIGNALNLLNITGAKKQTRRLESILKKIERRTFSPATYFRRSDEFAEMKESYSTSFVRKNGKLYFVETRNRFVELKDKGQYKSIISKINESRNRTLFYYENQEFFQEKVAGRKRDQLDRETLSEISNRYKEHKEKNNIPNKKDTAQEKALAQLGE